jgi:hypothetical protein
MEFAYLNVRLGKVPAVTPRSRPPVTAEQAKQVRALIARLAEIDRPDLGLSPTLTGTAFAPLPGRRQVQAGLLTDHRLGTVAAFRGLVELGPVAIPFLLDALGDRTRTRLTVRQPPAGMMGVGAYLPDGNPFNRAERKAREAGPTDPDDDYDGPADRYVVTVGDVCFVALGQIVGRPYQAVSYIPSGIVAVNSPASSGALRDRLRSVWGGADPARVLLDSLLIDYATEGLFNGRSLDGWYEGSNYQIGAAMRLLYYFPDEAAPLIAARLRTFDVADAGRGDGWIRRDVRNRVRTVEFLRAVSWCRAAPIREALSDVARRTDDPAVKEALTPDQD